MNSAGLNSKATKQGQNELNFQCRALQTVSVTTYQSASNTLPCVLSLQNASYAFART